MIFFSTYNNFLNPFSFADFLIIEDNKQGALLKDQVIAPFVKQVKITTLTRSNW